MTISGFTYFLSQCGIIGNNPNCHGLSREMTEEMIDSTPYVYNVDILTLLTRGDSVIIDFYLLLNKFSKEYGSHEENTIGIGVIEQLMVFFNVFKEHGVNLICVMDGKSPDKKKKAKRERKVESSSKQPQSNMIAGFIKDKDIYRIYDLISYYDNVTIVKSIGEADPLCVKIVRDKQLSIYTKTGEVLKTMELKTIKYVMTEDKDLCMFDPNIRIMNHVDFMNMTCSVLNNRKIIEHLGLSYEVYCNMLITHFRDYGQCYQFNSDDYQCSIKGDLKTIYDAWYDQLKSSVVDKFEDVSPIIGHPKVISDVFMMVFTTLQTYWREVRAIHVNVDAYADLRPSTLNEFIIQNLNTSTTSCILYEESDEDVSVV